MTDDDFPELPDFLNRRLIPHTGTNLPHMTRSNKPKTPTIIWPRKAIDRALRAKKAAAKAAYKAKKKKQRELERRG